MVEAAGIPSRLCTLSHPLVFAGVAGHSALSWRLRGSHCACRLRRGHVCSRVAKIMRSLDEFAGEKLTALEQAQIAPHAGGHGAGRNLGRARRPALTVVFLQRLPQSQPASRGDCRGHRGDQPLWRRRRRVAARHRQPPALCASSKAGWRVSRAPKRLASSARAISPILASSRRWSAPTI